MYYYRYNRPVHRNILVATIVTVWLFPFFWSAGYSYNLYSINNSTLVRYSNASCTMVRCKSAGCRTSNIVLELVTMVLPLLFNLVSYSLIMRVLVRTKANQLNTHIVVARALLTSLVFSLSWLPFFILFRVINYNGDNADQVYNAIMMFSHINTVTDPLLFILPNEVIRALLRKVVPPSLPKSGVETNKNYKTCNSGHKNANTLQER